MSFFIRIFTVVNAIATFHGIVLSFILWRKKKNRTANHILAALVFFFSIGMGGPIYVYYRLYYSFPYAAPFFSAIYFIFAPLLFLYIKALTQKDFKFKRIDILHTIPSLLNILYFSIVFFIPLSERIAFLEKVYFKQTIVTYISITLSLFQNFFYLMLCLGLIKKHSQKIKESFSVIEKINLSWMRHLVIMYGMILVVAFVLQGFLPKTLMTEKLDDAITFFLISIVIFSIGYRGLSQPEILAELPPESDPSNLKKYEKTGLSMEKGEIVQEKLIRLMEKEKLYIDQTLSLAQVAEKMRVPMHHLSQVINERIEQNFYRFVNKYRIEEAKRRLKNPKTKNDKLIKVAFDSGFNSLATFNRVFKDLIGESPSQFRKQKKDT